MRKIPNYLRSAFLSIEPPKSEVKWNSGRGFESSGDSTIAGFLTGVLCGLDPVQTLTGAVAVGACNVEAADALGGIIPWDEVQRRVQQGWKRLPLAIEADGWVWNELNRIWIGPSDGR
ncbi:MAG TPA: hypothetical protein VGK99_18305 [Acidobacteriota bacterium]